MSQQDITITVEPYLDDDRTRKIFDKQLVELRITPVKVTIRNDRKEPIRLIADSILLIDPVNIRYPTLTVSDILHEAAQRNRRARRFPIPGPIPAPPTPRRSPSGNKNLDNLELTLRSKELGERLVPPGSEEQGFLFFKLSGGTKTWAGSRLYIRDIRDLKTTERLLFFEIDLRGLSP